MKCLSHHASGSMSVIRVGLLLTVSFVFLGASVSGAELAEELRDVGYKIVHEAYQDGNWELLISNADGSQSRNLTQSPDANELYPHVSPDGKMICFVVDEGTGPTQTRSVFVMNMDGTGRKLVAKNARQACWKSDSSAIAYLKSESDKFSFLDYATKVIVVYDLSTGKHQEHENKEIHHLYNLCWSPDAKWFLATVHAGMGVSHAILAIEAKGTRVVNLQIHGCRPDISSDGTRVVWGPSDWALRIGTLDYSGTEPKVVDARDVVTSEKPMKIYHADLSPCGKYITFSRGPVIKRLGPVSEIVGIQAKDWNICVADVTTTNRWVPITTEGKSYKEPDWVPADASVEKTP